MARPSRTWAPPAGSLPLLGIVFVVVLIGAMVAIPFWSGREAASIRDEITTEIVPLAFAVDEYRIDAVGMAAGARGFAATRSDTSRQVYQSNRESLDETTVVLRDAAAGTEFAADADALIDVVQAYEATADSIIAAEDANNPLETRRLILELGEPQQTEVERLGSALSERVTTRQSELRDDLGGIDSRERLATAAAGALGLLAAALLAWLILSRDSLAREIEAQRARLDGLVSNIPGVVWEAWGQPSARIQRIDFVSDHVEDMLGYSTEEWLRTPNFWLTIVHPDDREAAAARADEIFRSRASGMNRFRWLAKDGRVLWVDAFATTILDEQGRPAGMRGVTLDVTPEREAQAAVDREAARYRSITAAIDYGVYETDHDGRLRYLNPAAERMFGWRLDEVIGRYTHPLFHPGGADGEPTPQEDCPIFQSGRTGAPYRGLEAFTRRNGAQFPVEVACTGISVDGAVTGAVVAFQDITARVQREQMRDDFVAFATHELRSPLTSLKGFAGWLARRAGEQPAEFDDEEREAITTLVDEAARMESTIDLFLDLARIEGNRLSLDLEPVDLKRVIASECEALAARHPHASCDVTLPAGSVIALTDDARVRQVMTNLLDNAAKYAGEKPRVFVTLGLETETGVIRVRDDGAGIPPEDQPYVFERYYRGRDAVSSRKKGLGVGLFITKQIVDRLGGSLEFTSIPGDGTEFVIHLPLVPAEDSLPDEPSIDTPSPGAPDDEPVGV